METTLINANSKPSEVDALRWIYCKDEDIYEQAHSSYDDPDLNGKWMMFFKKGEEMDQKWKEACDLYRQGKLDGIASMKVSTSMHDPVRSSDTTNGVICFYCGPANDEAALMTYGKNLLKNISYNSKFLRYKSDEQTRSGTAATGQKINSMYTIQVSDINSSAPSYGNSGNQNSSNQRWHAPKKMNSETNWRENQHSTTSSNENWRDRNRPQETNWRSGNRNQGPIQFRSNTSETNWRQPPRDYVPNSVGTSSVSNQNWRRNNVESNDNTTPDSKRS